MSAILQNHSEVFGVLWRRKLAQLSPERVTPTFVLDIMDGLHAGTHVRVTDDAVTMGGLQECHPALLDDALQSTALKLQMRRSVFGDMLHITDVSGDNELVLNDNPVRGTAADMLPATLVVNGIKLKIGHDAAESIKQSSGGILIDRVLKTSAVVALGCLLIFGFRMLGGDTHARTYDVSSQIGNLSQSTATSGADAMAQSVALENEFAQLGLDAYLTLDANADGSMVVNGALPAAMLPQWRTAREWQDRQENAATLISRFNVTKGLASLPAISLVRLSEPSTLVFVSGRRAVVDDEIDDGWVLSEITALGIELTRQGETVNVSF